MQKRLETIRIWLRERRAIIGKLFFELLIIFVGVSAAFALEGWRQEAEDNRNRERMIAALRPTLADMIRHNRIFDAQTADKLKAFDDAIARGDQPDLPIFREQNSERPPTRIWDSVVAVGAAGSLPPELLYRLGLFYTRQDSIGERYIRYNNFTESRVYTMGADQSAAYDASGKLKPEFAAYVDRLRDLQQLNSNSTDDATKLSRELDAFLRR
jgi:hypothetical protein